MIRRLQILRAFVFLILLIVIGYISSLRDRDHTGWKPLVSANELVSIGLDPDMQVAGMVNCNDYLAIQFNDENNSDVIGGEDCDATNSNKNVNCVYCKPGSFLQQSMITSANPPSPPGVQKGSSGQCGSAYIGVCSVQNGIYGCYMDTQLNSPCSSVLEYQNQPISQ